MRYSNSIKLAAALLVPLALASGGCNSGDSRDHDNHASQATSATGAQLPTGAVELTSTGDDHGHVGPHGGHIIELGRDHAYHAELVEDDAAQSVTIHILDGSMKPLAIDQDTISLTLQTGNRATTFPLEAVGGSPASAFKNGDKRLYSLLELSDHVQAKLRLSIQGTPHVGRFDHHAHGHDHSTHAH